MIILEKTRNEAQGILFGIVPCAVLLGGAFAMQDMIKKIVDMDEKAQEITEEAKRSKALSAQEIAEKKEQLRENYLARARKRIELNRIQEKDQARQVLVDAEKKYEAQSLKMQELYRQQGGNWVDAIVGRVIGE